MYEIAQTDLVAPLEYLPNVLTKPEAVTQTLNGDKKPPHKLNPREAWLENSVAWYEDPNRYITPYAADGPSSWPHIANADAPAVQTPIQNPASVSYIATSDDRISFDVDHPGAPVVVKASYFPNWKASGADGPYRISPNLMVVVPTSNHVELKYGRTGVDWLGIFGTLLGLVGVVWLYRRDKAMGRFPEPVEEVPPEGPTGDVVVDSMAPMNVPGFFVPVTPESILGEPEPANGTDVPNPEPRSCLKRRLRRTLNRRPPPARPLRDPVGSQQPIESDEKGIDGAARHGIQGIRHSRDRSGPAGCGTGGQDRPRIRLAHGKRGRHRPHPDLPGHARVRRRAGPVVRRGVQLAGLSVVDLGMGSTDMLYFAAGHLNSPGAMLTASHNPAIYNGIKLCRAGARPVGLESGLAEMKKWIADGNMPVTQADTTVTQQELLPDFVKHVHSFVDLSYCVRSRSSPTPPTEWAASLRPPCSTVCRSNSTSCTPNSTVTSRTTLPTRSNPRTFATSRRACSKRRGRRPCIRR